MGKWVLMDKKHYHSTDISPLGRSDLFSCNDKISTMSDNGSAALGCSVEVKSNSVYSVSWSLAILDGALLLGNHFTTINEPLNPSEATRLATTTLMSLFHAAEMKKSSLRTPFANYLKKKKQKRKRLELLFVSFLQAALQQASQDRLHD